MAREGEAVMDLLYAEFANYEEVKGRFAQARALLRATVAAEDVKKIVVEEIRGEAPTRKGGLRAGIDGRVVYLPDNAFDLEITSDAFYTKWVIGGRGWVYPVRARALHWVTPEGKDVFAMSARPTTPNPFHERGWEKAKPRIERKWRAMGETVAYVLAA